MNIGAAIPTSQEPTPSLRTDWIASTRLWPALARSRRRVEPTKGADVFGEWVLGLRKRRHAQALEHDSAAVIIARARALAASSEAVLDHAIEAARDAVRLHRTDPAVVCEAFAVIHEAVRREIGLKLHPEQVLGALAMIRGCCAELATGEGKTVTAILPGAIEGWLGRGVHVITVNDYLARRDAEITGPAFRRLGLGVGVIQETSTREERRDAYAADLTYAADKQLLFDHLRDRLLSPLAPRLTKLLLDDVFPRSPHDARGIEKTKAWTQRVVQRGLQSAIVDEADSVLVDDAITPAIISGDEQIDPDELSQYRIAAEIARELQSPIHYSVDKRMKRVSMTALGRELLGTHADRLPAAWSSARRREELIVQALGAKDLYVAGDDYIVREGKIQIVDRSTGRVLAGRQWQLGVHQAMEAKEGIELTPERITSSRCSYQSFFQRYRFLAGMTGSAKEVAAEMWRWYRLPVVPVPIRTRRADVVLDTEDAKFERVAERVVELHALGRPVLVGTRSVNASERLSSLLIARGLVVSVLNANREAEEAAIVARAGQRGAITVATNMAGRGTDIILTEETRRSGGLAVIATERHDEPRVDRQLFGRAGRQGDPGSAEAIVSLEDPLIREHGPRFLAALVRASGSGRRTMLARLLWWWAQRAGSKKWSTIRSETVRAEAAFDMSMNQLTR
jgi:preprotein translocase subunit SecA